MQSVLTVFFTFVLGLCASTSVEAEPEVVRMATTTSTENSGLLSALLPEFKARTGVAVQVIAVGTGKALQMGRDGDVDVVLVHAREAEEKFVGAGHGVNRRDVMYNDFVIVGPAADPAGAGTAASAASAFGSIAAAPALFVSRGDDSGTHQKEREIWLESGIEPSGAWYREVGQGMGKTLQMADELEAYTLVDRGTWLAHHGRVQLSILGEGDPALYNPYGIIAVNPAKYSDVNYEGAMRLIAWMTSVEGQRIIRDFRVQRMPLFRPMAVKQ